MALARRDYWDIDRLTTVPAEAPYPHSGQQMVAFFLIFFLTFLSFVLCALRTYWRVRTRKLGWAVKDDTLILLALVLIGVEDGAQYMFLRETYTGIHYWDIPQHDPRDGWSWDLMAQTVYYPILSLVKASVLIYLLRLSGAHQRVRLACRTLLWFEILKGIASFLASLLQCWPVGAARDMTASAGCDRRDIFAVVMASLNIATDLLALLLPFYMFLNLKVARKARIALMVVFSMGFLVLIVSAIRLYDVVWFWTTYQQDRQWSIGYTMSSVECNMAVITACLPPLWPFARHMAPKFFEERLGLNQPCYADIEIHHYPAGTPRPYRSPSKSTSTRTIRAAGGGDDAGDDMTITTRWRTGGAFPGPRAVYAHRSIGGSVFLIGPDAEPGPWYDLAGTIRGGRAEQSAWHDEADDEGFVAWYHRIVRATAAAAAAKPETVPTPMGDTMTTTTTTTTTLSAVLKDDHLSAPER